MFSPPPLPPFRYNHAIVPGRTIVVGTEQGLYARVARLAAPVLRLRSTTDDGTAVEHEFPLQEEMLAKVCDALLILCCSVEQCFQWRQSCAPRVQARHLHVHEAGASLDENLTRSHGHHLLSNAASLSLCC